MPRGREVVDLQAEAAGQDKQMRKYKARTDKTGKARTGKAGKATNDQPSGNGGPLKLGLVRQRLGLRRALAAVAVGLTVAVLLAALAQRAAARLHRQSSVRLAHTHTHTIRTHIVGEDGAVSGMLARSRVRTHSHTHTLVQMGQCHGMPLLLHWRV